MRSEIVSKCRRYAHNGYSTAVIAERLGLTVNQVLYALDETGGNGSNRGGQNKVEGSPDDLIDGERLADRIERMTAEFRKRAIHDRSQEA